MTSNRKQNLWVTPTKRGYDNFSRSTIRGYSNIGSRVAGYSKTKVDEPTSGYSNISNKRLGGKEQIYQKEEKGNILNERSNGSYHQQYNGYHLMKLKEKEEWAKEQKRQQVERMKLIERVDQSKKEFMEKERLRQMEIEVQRQKEKDREQEDYIRTKQTSSVRIPSSKDIPQSSITNSRKMLVGLNNIGNTCYMNSALQCMLHIPHFNDYFLSTTFRQELRSSGRVADAYGKLVSLMYNSSNRSQTPNHLKQSLGMRFHQFSGYSQQDAQELLVSLRESLNDDLSRVDKKKAKYKELTADTGKSTLAEISQEWWSYSKLRDDSIVEDFFCGQLMSKVICRKCKNASIAFDNFEDLNLSFEKYETSSELSRMIELFLREETLSDDFFCSKCKQLRQSSKKLAIFRLPRVLIIQLKRFSYGKYRKQKINTKINFPNQLDLSSFITQSKHSSVQNPKYQLIGVVNHSGGIDFGHYTADCQDISTGKWYNFNDSSVSESSYNNSHNYSSSYPYLLFYFKK